jgi:hypothetical protein
MERPVVSEINLEDKTRKEREKEVRLKKFKEFMDRWKLSLAWNHWKFRLKVMVGNKRIKMMRRKEEFIQGKKNESEMFVEDNDKENEIRIKARSKAGDIGNVREKDEKMLTIESEESWLEKALVHIFGEDLMIMVNLKIRRTKKRGIRLKGIKFKLKKEVEGNKMSYVLNSIEKSWENGPNITNLKNIVGKVRGQIMAEDVCCDTITKITVRADVGGSQDIVHPVWCCPPKQLMDYGIKGGLISHGNKKDIDADIVMNHDGRIMRKVRLKESINDDSLVESE